VTPGDSPVIWLIKLPKPDPSAVLDPEVVGFGSVPQQIPLEETVAPPSPVTLPPLFADVGVTSLTEVVVTDGALFTGSPSGLVFVQPAANTNSISTTNKDLLIFADIA
jgi:hypothetical protein